MKLIKRNILAAVFLFLCTLLHAEISVEYLGAAQRVSGSCAIVQNGKSSVIVDCGAFYEERGLASDNSFLDKRLMNAKALILTHAHMDHSGRIPYLISGGFRGPVYATAATRKIIFEMYNDGWAFENVKQKYFWSSKKLSNINKIQKGTLTLHFFGQCAKSVKSIKYSEKETSMSELEQKYKVKCRLCKKCLKRYLDDMRKQFKDVGYNVPFEISEDIKVTFIKAGHITGSASAVFDVSDGGENRTIVFSGDLGSGYSNITEDKQIPERADCVFVESTYGGSSKNVGFDDYRKFRNSVASALRADKLVWIPSLALHRTQKVLYEIKKAQDQGLISGDIKIFSLSPSSNGITDLYENEIKNPSQDKWFIREVYDGGTLLPENYQTKKPQKFPRPSVVISASGMMDKGTSATLINKLLPSDDTAVFLVSYAGADTPAGQLKRGLKKIKTKYGTVRAAASTEEFDIFSDHPDMSEILKWLSKQDWQTSIYLIHGEKENLQKSKDILRKKGFLHTDTVIPGKAVIVN